MSFILKLLIAIITSYQTTQTYQKWRIYDEQSSISNRSVKWNWCNDSETITPPIFGAYCSSNARECIKRIAQYKALVGAITFEVSDNESGVTVNIKREDNEELPEIIVGIEMILLTNLIRKATKEHIVTVKVSVKKAFVNNFKNN